MASLKSLALTLALACMASSALAKPLYPGTGTGTTTLAPRGETDCPAGKQWYVCANGARGCYAYDACSVATSTSTSTPTPVAAAASCPTGRLFTPTMYPLHPASPDAAGTAGTALDLDRRGNVSSVEALAVFGGLPAGARSCSLGWAQAGPDARDFAVTGSGYLEALQLSGKPDTAVSAGSVAPLERQAVRDGAAVTHPDMTFWDQPQYPAQEHGAGAVACAGEVVLRVKIDGANGAGKVHFAQDGQNGLFVSYKC
ncbi:hypothetical protein F4780DRAFT_791851 [Xylariomycetidae sp. FL0641]|nr:hypothetical protein F4780DRAFT_791851 [Xylariomycetidae sp. FL0641]